MTCPAVEYTQLFVAKSAGIPLRGVIRKLGCPCIECHEKPVPDLLGQHLSSCCCSWEIPQSSDCVAVPRAPRRRATAAAGASRYAAGAQRRPTAPGGGRGVRNGDFGLEWRRRTPGSAGFLRATQNSAGCVDDKLAAMAVESADGNVGAAGKRAALQPEPVAARPLKMVGGREAELGVGEPAFVLEPGEQRTIACEPMGGARGAVSVFSGEQAAQGGLNRSLYTAVITTAGLKTIATNPFPCAGRPVRAFRRAPPWWRTLRL